AAPSTPAKEAPVKYSARECLSRMDGQAQRWATDALVFHVESDINPETDGHGGKSTVWKGIYASASRQTIRTFTCSGSREAYAPPLGVTGELELAYKPSATPFQAFLVKADSDKAFEVAQQHGGEALLKKDPQLPVTYLLAMERGQSVPTWFVIYGKSMQDNKGIGMINATTGGFLRATGGK
ncbi:MAG TPA: hypothetical protein VFU76_17930, partial [Terriglobales bacterium]|nr:hypothetical protein [Terriglobales bacterium]